MKLLLEENFFSSDRSNDAATTGPAGASESLVLVDGQGATTKAPKWGRLALGHVSQLLVRICKDEAFVARLKPENKRLLAGLYISVPFSLYLRISSF